MHRPAAAAAALLLSAHAAMGSDLRTFTVRYTATVAPMPGSQGPLDLFVPLPPQTDVQDVLALRIESPVEGAQSAEPRFHNRFWHARLARSADKPIEVAVIATVRRKAWRGPLDAPGPSAYSADEKARLSPYLMADKRVPLAGGPIDKIDAEIGQRLGERATDPSAVARAIYDYVVDNMEYKKVGTGWGNGDTFWACSAKYGNCTDFHALFLSLARRRGIPARFEMGFPIPSDKPAGKVAGYHCWVEFWLPGRGWVPVDASEARKHPEQRDALFGGQPNDRVQLSEGRDLLLPGMKDEPLNYFVYPYLEVAGAPGPAVAWTFEYKDVPTSAAP
jgi:transglutaminase-like putative cysteine protease